MSEERIVMITIHSILGRERMGEILVISSENKDNKSRERNIGFK